jgi:protein-disulfide isomerase
MKRLAGFLAIAVLLGAGGYWYWSTQQRDDSVAFEIDGETVSVADLPVADQVKLYRAEKASYDARLRVLQDALLERHLKSEAAKTGRDIAELRHEALDPISPTEAALKKVFDKNRIKLPFAFASIKSELSTYVQGEEREKLRQQAVTKAMEDAGGRLALMPPRAPVFDVNLTDRQRLGPDGAAVTIVEFGDLSCPHCAEAAPVLKKLVERAKGEVQLRFMDYPLEADGHGADLARGGLCADRQKKFWEYQDRAYEAVRGFQHTTPAKLAKTVSLDQAAFDACLNEPAVATAVGASRAEGDRLGVVVTPTLLINGALVDGYGEQALVATVEEALGHPLPVGDVASEQGASAAGAATR